MRVEEFRHEDGRECIRVGSSLAWFYDGGSEKGDVCKRAHIMSEAPSRPAEGFVNANQQEPTRLWEVAPTTLAGTMSKDRARIAALTSALERTEANFIRAVNGFPVRDMAETLAENSAALATS